MANQTRTGFKAFKNTQLADNTVQAINELVSRNVAENLADSAVFRKTDKFTRNGGTTSGSTTAYTLEITNDYPAVYTTDIFITFKINAPNTGSAPTLNVNTIGAKTIKKQDGTAINSGDLALNRYYGVVYNGTDFFNYNWPARGGRYYGPFHMHTK